MAAPFGLTPDFSWVDEGNDPVAAQAAAEAAALRTRRSVLGQPGDGIRAYHGSPHDFDRFDLSKIGTGEGAQSYGHGLYFAENPKVAESYKKDVSMMLHRNNPGWTPVQEEAATRFYANDQDHAKAVKDISDRINDSRMYGDSPASLKTLNDAHDLLRGGWKPPGGKMYEVNIGAKPDQFLDWDKPLREQGPYIDAAMHDLLRGIGMSKEHTNYLLNNKTGQDVLRQLSRPSYPIRDNAQSPWRDSGAKSYDEALAKVGGDKSRAQMVLTPDRVFATEALRERGVPGIKYADQGSRGRAVSTLDPQIAKYRARLATDKTLSGSERDQIRGSLDDLLAERAGVVKGTSNYVVGDDAIIRILRKYAIPGAAGAGGFGSLAPGSGDHQ